MTSRPVRPRLAPLPREAWSEEVRTMIERTPGGATEPLNIFTTLVRHPTLVRRWLPFGTMLLTGEQPPRDRELLILRTAWNCRSEYEWGQHVRIGLAAGLAQEEIDRVPAGPAAPGWSPFDAALLRAADALPDARDLGVALLGRAPHLEAQEKLAERIRAVLGGDLGHPPVVLVALGVLHVVLGELVVPEDGVPVAADVAHRHLARASSVGVAEGPAGAHGRPRVGAVHP